MLTKLKILVVVVIINYVCAQDFQPTPKRVNIPGAVRTDAQNIYIRPRPRSRPNPRQRTIINGQEQTITFPSRNALRPEANPHKFQPLKEPLPPNHSAINHPPFNQQPINSQPIIDQPISSEPFEEEPIIEQQPLDDQSIGSIEARPIDNRPVEHRTIEHRPNEHRPNEHRPNEHRPNEHRLNDHRFSSPNANLHKQKSKERHQERVRYQEDQARSAHYSFDSSVNDSINDQTNTRSETRDGLAVTGMYSYSDGFFKRTVYYRADETGYRVEKQEVEPIGDGPQYNPDGKADVSSSLIGSYSVTADDFKKAPRQNYYQQQYDRE